MDNRSRFILNTKNYQQAKWFDRVATKSGDTDNLDFCLFKPALLILGYAIITSSFHSNWHLRQHITDIQRLLIHSALCYLTRVHGTIHCWWGTNTTINLCVIQCPWPSCIVMLKIMYMCQHFQTLRPLCIWYLLYLSPYRANFVLKNVL